MPNSSPGTNVPRGDALRLVGIASWAAIYGTTCPSSHHLLITPPLVSYTITWLLDNDIYEVVYHLFKHLFHKQPPHFRNIAHSLDKHQLYIYVIAFLRPHVKYVYPL